MFSVDSHFTFGSFLAAFPLPIFAFVVCVAPLAVRELARTNRISRSFLVSFWKGCWTIACCIALGAWYMQKTFFASVIALETTRNSIAYFENQGYTASQSLHYHFAVLTNIAANQSLRYQELGSALWYEVFF